MSLNIKVAVFIVIFLIAIIYLAHENSGSQTKIAQEIIEEINENGEAKIIVVLNENVTEKGFLGFGKREEEVNIDEVEKLIGQERIENEFSSFKGFSVEVTELELEQLEKDSRVKTIEFDKPVQAFMQESVGIVNATTIWQNQIKDINLTGKDEAICIIDTGVNYNHPDFGSCTQNDFISGNCRVVSGFDFVNDDNNSIDDNGHGTHVAGSAAANGLIKGIAPEAKLVALKVLDSSGSGLSSDIIAAIDWCVENSSTYNISVISLSLGVDCDITPSGCYSNYCDSSETSFSSSINKAIQKNISVVVATGNDFNKTHISLPSCIKNATRVAASSKADVFVGFSNRGNFQILVSPGLNINSTYLATYTILSGTSMAAPQVAGAFALLRQFKKLEKNQTLKPSEIENALNSTGKIVNDEGTGLNFERINVYSAILSLDKTSPNVTLTSPTNNTKTLTQNITFNCNATDLQLKNITLILWNSTGIYNQTSISVNGTFNKTNTTLTNLDPSEYNWNCFVCDSQDNCAYSTINFTLTVSNLVVALISPSNNLKSQQQSHNFTCNTTSNSVLTNTTFYLWNSTSSLIYNETKDISGLNNQTNFSYNFTQNNNYKWNCLSSNNQSLSTFHDSNFTFSYDTIPPSLDIILPKNNSWLNSVKFNISLNEETSNCVFSLDNTENTSMTKFNDTYFNYTNSNITEAQHNVTFSCNDTAGNLNSSSLIFFNIDKSLPNITLISPNAPYSLTSSSIEIIFEFNVSDNLNINFCELQISGSSDIIQKNQSLITISSNISYTLTPGAYNWQINCTDEAGNLGNSTTRSLTIISPPSQGQGSGGGSSGSSGGGGGGGGALLTPTTYTLTNEQLSSNLTKDLGVNENLKFTFERVIHQITLKNLTNNTATIIVSSTPQQATLSIVEEKMFELNDDEFYDLFVKLNYIRSNKANLMVRLTHEKFPENNSTSFENNFTESTPEKPPITGAVTSESINNKNYIAIYFIFLVILVVLFLIFKWKRK